MRRWYQSKTSFEKRYDSFRNEEWAASLQFMLSSISFRFPIRSFYSDHRQIDSVYLELTCFCFFSIDLHLATSIPDTFEGKESLREAQFDFNYLVFKEMWNDSPLLGGIINNRMKFYGEAATGPMGWPIAEIAMNIHLSATISVNRDFRNARQLPPIDPVALRIGSAWQKWAMLVTYSVPECWNILFSE